MTPLWMSCFIFGGDMVIVLKLFAVVKSLAKENYMSEADTLPGV